MRKEIWNHYREDLNLELTEIDVTKSDAKNIWDKLCTFLPQYSLFQSDRKNSDGDSEVQDPLKEAVKQILSNTELQETLNEVAQRVKDELRRVSDGTLAKLQEINPQIASTLNPILPELESLKWFDVFKNVSISGDEDIPINKRGSGVKRLILLSFFRAEAERRSGEGNSGAIIYAIEEPETSQHSEHQKIITDAFKELGSADNTQVLLTTHSSTVVKKLDFSNLRLIKINESGSNNNCVVTNVESDQLPYPSLNEVNFIAFGDATEEYHNELYGFIESNSWLNDFIDGKEKRMYRRETRSGIRKEQKTLTEYIRHQIHHPENKNNTRYNYGELNESINLMRTFINNKI